MKVTIITATYNSENCIQRAIDSVANQDYKNIEHIIVDGGSTDGTLSIIKSNLNKIATYISEKDNGIYSAFNTGLKLATGDIIGFLNSDDTYNDPHVISRTVNSFTIKKCDVLYGNLVYQSRNSEKSRTIRYWKSNVFHPNCLKYGWMPPHPTVYCKKEIYEKYGYFDENFRISADYDFILRVFKDSTVRKTYLPIVMVKMDVGGASNGSFKGICRKSREDFEAIKRNQIGGFYTLFCKNFRKVMQFSKFRISKYSC